MSWCYNTLMSPNNGRRQKNKKYDAKVFTRIKEPANTSAQAQGAGMGY